MRSCPPENMGAGRSEQEISLTAGIPLRSCSRSGDAQDLGVLHPAGPLVALTGDPLEAGAGVSADRDAAHPAARALPSVGEWLTLHERGVDQQR